MRFQNIIPCVSASLFIATSAHASYVAEDAVENYLVVFKKGSSWRDFHPHTEMLARFNPYCDNSLDYCPPPMKWFQFTEKGERVYGYSANLVPEVRQTVITDTAVEYIEKDLPVYALETVEQKKAPWGLARASTKGKVTENGIFRYREGDGEGVTVYVIDTGIYVKHSDFEDRARWGNNFAHDADVDGNGHGTHCSGTIAGKTYGMAKKAELIAVKVLDARGSGSMSGVIAGVEWATTDHKKHSKTRKGSVANMSLGGGKSITLNRAVAAAVDAGIHFVVAAGNDYRDACMYSPASEEKAITVGATTEDDEMAFFSNYGECTNVFAPGYQITSTWIGGKHATNTISGTSMASPHTAGLVAALLSRPEHANISPKKMQELVYELATKDVLTKVPEDTINAVIYNDYEE